MLFHPASPTPPALERQHDKCAVSSEPFDDRRPVICASMRHAWSNVGSKKLDIVTRCVNSEPRNSPRWRCAFRRLAAGTIPPGACQRARLAQQFLGHMVDVVVAEHGVRRLKRFARVDHPSKPGGLVFVTERESYLPQAWPGSSIRSIPGRRTSADQ